MNWEELTTVDQLDDVIRESEEFPVMIFKHSTRCSISSMVMNRLERSWEDTIGVKPYYLDLIRYREISNMIEQKLGVMHQSPQAIVVDKQKVVYYDSHMGISYQDIMPFAKS